MIKKWTPSLGQLLEPLVLAFQLLQTAHLRYAHSTIFTLPAIVCLFGDIMLPAEVFDLHTCFCLVQNTNDLFFCESALHMDLLPSNLNRSLTFQVDQFFGERSGPPLYYFDYKCSRLVKGVVVN